MANLCSNFLRMKSQLEEISSKIQQNERKLSNFDPKDFISARLDLSNFSTHSKRLFQNSHSQELSEALQNTAKALLEKTHAKYAFTHSDEISLIIPSKYHKNPKFIHQFNGRRDKFISLIASFASIILFKQLLTLKIINENQLSNLDSHQIHFDCRAASWENEEQAFDSIVWRAHDCYRNGVSDAIYKSNIPNKSNAIRLKTDEKLDLLKLHDISLDDHQLYGSLYRRTKVSRSEFCNETGKDVIFQRNIIEKINGSVLDNVKLGVFEFL